MAVAVDLATAHREALELARSATCLTPELIALALGVAEGELPALYADPDRLTPAQRIRLTSMLIPVAMHGFTSDPERAVAVSRALFDSLEQTARYYGNSEEDERDLVVLRKILFPA